MWSESARTFPAPPWVGSGAWPYPPDRFAGAISGRSQVLPVRAGKQHRERTAYVVDGGRDALDYWLKFRGHDPGPLLVPVSKSGTVTLRRMSTQALLLRLRRRCEQAGVRRCSPHDLRRSFVSGLLDCRLDLGRVKDLVGHANPKTTRRGDEVRRQGAAKLHVPFQAPRCTAGAARTRASPGHIPGVGTPDGTHGIREAPPVGSPGGGLPPSTFGSPIGAPADYLPAPRKDGGQVGR